MSRDDLLFDLDVEHPIGTTLNENEVVYYVDPKNPGVLGGNKRYILRHRNFDETGQVINETLKGIWFPSKGNSKIGTAYFFVFGSYSEGVVLLDNEEVSNIASFSFETPIALPKDAEMFLGASSKKPSLTATRDGSNIITNFTAISRYDNLFIEVAVGDSFGSWRQVRYGILDLEGQDVVFDSVPDGEAVVRLKYPKYANGHNLWPTLEEVLV